MKTKGNKRRSQRRKCSVPVDAKKGTTFECVRAVDICRGGMGFISNKSISVNEKIIMELELQPEDHCPVLMMGQIKWIQKESGAKKYRIGVEFTEELATESQQRLQEYLR